MIVTFSLASVAFGDAVIVTESRVQQPMDVERTTIRTYKYKGDWVKSETQGEKTRILTNERTGDIYSIDENGKVTKSDYGQRKPASEESAKNLAKIGGADGRLEWKSTGRHEKVGEWETEIFAFQGPLSKGTAWVALSLASLGKLQAGTEDSKLIAKQFFPDKASLPGLIVREEVEMNMGAVMQKSLPREAQGNVDYTAMRVRFVNRVLSVEQKDLPESEFAPPSD